jgi:hypothetical protein
MEPISRRAVLTMGGLGLVGTVVGGTGMWRELNPSELDPASSAVTRAQLAGTRRREYGKLIRSRAAAGTLRAGP